MERDKQGSGIAEPLFFGALEVACFAFLFLTPALGKTAVTQGWFCLVLWRVIALSGLFSYSHFEESLSEVPGRYMKERLALMSRSVLYGIPFWCSSFFFPLRQNQAEVVSQVLVLYSILLLLCFALSALKTHWYPGIVGLLSVAWFQQGPTGELKLSWLMLVPLSVLLWPRDSKLSKLDTGTLRMLCLLGSMGWTFCLYLARAPEGPGELVSLALIHWILLCMMGADLLGLGRFEKMARPFEREVELGLPALGMALEWVYSRRFLRNWLPWFLALPLGLWTGESPFLILLVGLAVPGLLKLAVRGANGDALQWWVCWQFVILWGVAETPSSSVPAWITIAFLSSFFFFRATVLGSDREDFQLCEHQGRLESSLRRELRLSAPPEMKSSIMAQLEPSIEFDQSLASTAPKGFRERLLERLRRDSADEESS